jgi:hypothetical protein
MPVLFCRRCGVAWDPAWTTCPQCERKAVAIVEASNTRLRSDVGQIKSAVALYFAMLAVSVVAIVAVHVAGELTVRGQLVYSGAMSVIVLIWCLVAHREVVPTLLRTASTGWYVIGALSAIPTYILATVVVQGLVAMGVEKIGYIDMFVAEGYGMLLPVLVVCAQPAIFEELAFRGVIQSSLQQVLSGNEGIVVSALMFGIVHLSVPSMPHLVTIGLVLGWLRVRTGSLYPGMVMHFVHNFLVVQSERAGGMLPW